MSFIFSKLLWILCAPLNALAFLLFVGARMASSRKKSRHHKGVFLCTWLSFILILIIFLPFDTWLLAPLENSFQSIKPGKIDGIIILSGDEDPRITDQRGVPSMQISALRYIAFLGLVREYPSARLVFTGGSGQLRPYQNLTVADVMKSTMHLLGFNPEAMIIEDQARNTYENARLTADIVKPAAEQNWILVTSAWHMQRALASFRKQGWTVYAWPTDYRSGRDRFPTDNFNLTTKMENISLALHEYIGLIAYWLMGYTDKPWFL